MTETVQRLINSFSVTPRKMNQALVQPQSIGLQESNTTEATYMDTSTCLVIHVSCHRVLPWHTHSFRYVSAASTYIFFQGIFLTLLNQNSVNLLIEVKVSVIRHQSFTLIQINNLALFLDYKIIEGKLCICFCLLLYSDT